MMKLFYNILIFSVLISISPCVLAQSKESKKIEKTYYLSRNGGLYLDNKYGDVLIYGWDKNSIEITVDIEANRKTDDDAKALLKRIKSNITATKSQVIIESEILEKETSFFNRYINKIDPFKNEGASTTIDYIIYLPKQAEIEINNKYGDVIISDWSGQLKAKVEHGDLRITDNIANSKISISYGKLRAYTLSKSNIHAKGASLSIRESNRLKLESDASEVHLNTINELELHSNNDDIEISDLNTVFGSVKYSKVEIENLKTSTNLDLNLAELRILKMQKQPKININQSASEVYINIINTNFDFSAKLEQGVLRVPKTMQNINSEVLDKKKKIRSVIANYGKEKEKGMIIVSGQKGLVILKEL